MTMLTEPVHPNESLVSEANGDRSRESITVASGAVLKACAVLGAAYGDATSAAKSGGNTGNGTVTMDATNPTLAHAKPGVYTLRCIEAATNGGTFRLEDPDGTVLGDFTISGGAGGTAAFAEQVKGVITDGSTDFAVGDGFDITVPNTQTFGPIDFDASNGMNVGSAISYGDYDGTDGEVPGVAYVRDCEHNAAIVVWPTGTTTDQKVRATRDLAEVGIILR
ncbi:head decoration protein [Altererythrobacter indicus]|uniref:Head decoration protein n=1 Tax=Altericroceibacterium indicum TaxID=374177 RepID=A0A845ACB3_9SPHN|nr:head decoration protein [Altericroceibacterium indicum]MXP24818.1 head decoration protein [Altericroceibacterium indicum]